MKSKTRFSRKCDKIFWMIVSLLPIIVYCFTYANVAQIYREFSHFIAHWRFEFIGNIFDDVFFSADLGRLPSPMVDYLSYVIGVEVMHCFFDVIVFIPRLAHKWIGKAVQDE